MREVNIVYGSSHNKGVAFVRSNNISSWYIVKGGYTANKTYDKIVEGCSVEDLRDIDCMTSMKPINTIKQFEKFLAL